MLFLVWHAANRICAKRLVPFSPPSSKHLRGMITYIIQRSAEANCSL